MPLARLIPFRRRTRPFDLNGMGGWEMFDRDIDRLFDRFFLGAYEHRTPDRRETPVPPDTGKTP
ncbi:MAG: hypothetical protein JWO78_79 [Micavibrio sp.]|nr:hypothetical protein [Micavibrio sp.]